MKKWLIWGIPALLLIGLVVWRFTARGATQGTAGGGKGGGGKMGAGGGPAVVEVSPVTGRVIVQSVTSVGDAESPFKVEVSPKTAGRITFLQAREGDPVHAGQVLLKIDPSDLQGALVQQQANIAEAKSRLAQAQITTVSTDVGIQSQIQQQVAAVASAQADLNQTSRNYDAQVAQARSQVSAAVQGVRSAQSNVAKETATLANLRAHYNRLSNLFSKGYSSRQELEDAQTAATAQESVVTVAQDSVSSAQSQLNVQQQNLTIVQRKGQADIAASKARLNQAQASLRSAQANRSQSPAYRANLSALQSQVSAAQAQYAQAQARLRDTIVSSSVNGIVTARKADPGNLASPGSPVLEVQFLDWMYVTASIPLESASTIHPGQMAQITFDALPGKTLSGPVANVNPAGDPQSRQFTVLVRLDNANHSIRPGMYGHVTIITGQVTATTVVPREALQTAQDGATTVTVVDKDNVAHVVPVRTGISDDKGVQILSGVNPGDRVVVLTYTPVRDGQKVQIGGPGQGSGGAGRSGRGGGKRRGGATQGQQ